MCIVNNTKISCVNIILNLKALTEIFLHPLLLVLLLRSKKNFSEKSMSSDSQKQVEKEAKEKAVMTNRWINKHCRVACLSTFLNVSRDRHQSN